MSNRLVGDREFTKVVASHLGLDLDGGKGLAVVDTDDRANHLGDNDHVTEVGLDDGWLLVGAGLLLGLAELLDQAHGAGLESALETAAGTSVDKLNEGLVLHVEEGIELDATVGVLLEGTGGLLGGGFLSGGELGLASVRAHERSDCATAGLHTGTRAQRALLFSTISLPSFPSPPTILPPSLQFPHPSPARSNSP